MNTQHTPGPWHVGGTSSATVVVQKKNDGAYVRVWGPDHAGVAQILTRKSIYEDGASAEMLANAHLIAAAPELLAVLRELRRCTGKCINTPQISSGEVFAAIEAADAAIAKAEGK